MVVVDGREAATVSWVERRIGGGCGWRREVMVISREENTEAVAATFSSGANGVVGGRVWERGRGSRRQERRVGNGRG